MRQCHICGGGNRLAAYGPAGWICSGCRFRQSDVSMVNCRCSTKPETVCVDSVGLYTLEAIMREVSNG